MSKQDALAYIYIQIDDLLYKIVTLKTGSDGSIYIATPLGAYPLSSGITNTKFTYHPDGKTWTTSTLDLSSIGIDMVEFNEKAPDTLRAMGLGYKNNKIYTSDFGVDIPLDQINEVVYTKFGVSYFNIATINSKSEILAIAKSSKKIDLATIIDGSNYGDITLRFYLVPERHLQERMEKAASSHIEAYSFKHPTYGFYIVASVEDEWLGEKHEKDNP
jgi:hypothetical protein